MDDYFRMCEVQNVQSFTNVVHAFLSKGARDVKIFLSRRDETTYAVCTFDDGVDVYSCPCFGDDVTGRFFRIDDESDFVDVSCGWAELLDF
jgi:hypothetical protein